MKALNYIAFAAAVMAAPFSLSAKKQAPAPEVSVPGDTAAMVIVQDEMIYYPGTTTDSRLEGEWFIDNINGEKVTGENRPFLNFNIAEGRVYGNNGCNIINANIETAPDNKLRFSNMLSTRMMCADAPFEYLINTTLDQVRGYKVSRYGHEYYLDLLNDRGHLIMVLRKHNMDFLNGAWQVTEIDGQPNTNEGIRFVIDLPEKKLHGNAGCNIVNGEITVDPDVTNSLQFSNLITTRMMCPDIATETSVLVALEETEKAFAKSDDSVTFVNHAGQPVLKLVRIDPRTLQDD
ncbi:MAG: META domain-containing protein [Barnesiella sp.]|nr:META domain-containing protein [Barnesiella sp.]